jgi:hypothetical protein
MNSRSSASAAAAHVEQLLAFVHASACFVPQPVGLASRQLLNPQSPAEATAFTTLTEQGAVRRTSSGADSAYDGQAVTWGKLIWWAGSHLGQADMDSTQHR